MWAVGAAAVSPTVGLWLGAEGVAQRALSGSRWLSHVRHHAGGVAQSLASSGKCAAALLRNYPVASGKGVRPDGCPGWERETPEFRLRQ